MLNVLNLKHFLRANFPTPLGIDSQGCQNSLDFFNFFFHGLHEKILDSKVCTLKKSISKENCVLFASLDDHHCVMPLKYVKIKFLHSS